MKFQNANSQLFIPDEAGETDAFRRSTHLGIGAHQDDLEFMALHGILAGYNRKDQWFGGITVTNGAGSSRTGAYTNFTDEEMMLRRKDEQNQAAVLGQYSFMAQLDYSSACLKDPENTHAEEELKTLLTAIQPEVVYTHNPADKHDTHIAVMAAVINAARSLPPEQRPSHVFGCEVWRGLDWMMDADKIIQDLSGFNDLAEKLNSLFDSQISGGKRYDLAVQGRRCANATFLEPHASDEINQASFAMDLSPLVRDDTLDVEPYVMQYVQRFTDDVQKKLRTAFG